MLARSTPIPGSHARLLSPEDNLLQVALHTAKHSYVREPGFRLHFDVERIVRQQSVDWEQFLERVSSCQVKTPVFFSLALPHVLFDTPVPKEVLEELAPRAWRRKLVGGWVRRIGLLESRESKFHVVSFCLFHMLLYDGLRHVVGAIFPNSAWMRERYGISSAALLPF